MSINESGCDPYPNGCVHIQYLHRMRPHPILCDPYPRRVTTVHYARSSTAVTGCARIQLDATRIGENERSRFLLTTVRLGCVRIHMDAARIRNCRSQNIKGDRLIVFLYLSTHFSLRPNRFCLVQRQNFHHFHPFWRVSK